MLRIRVSDIRDSKSYEGFVLSLESDLSMSLDTHHQEPGSTFWLHRLSVEDIKTLADALAEAYQDAIGKEEQEVGSNLFQGCQVDRSREDRVDRSREDGDDVPPV